MLIVHLSNPDNNLHALNFNFRTGNPGGANFRQPGLFYFYNNSMKEIKKFKIYPENKKSFYFLVYIHPTQKSLRGHWDSLDKSFVPHSSKYVKAFCLRNPVSLGKCIGEIHLQKNSPTDIIAHECLHALLHWGKLKNLNIYHAEEDFCYIYQTLIKSVLKHF
jgi:hypothetical protein